MEAGYGEHSLLFVDSFTDYVITAFWFIDLVLNFRIKLYRKGLQIMRPKLTAWQVLLAFFPIAAGLDSGDLIFITMNLLRALEDEPLPTWDVFVTFSCVVRITNMLEWHID